MATKHILQVSELTKKVKFMLESELNTVWLCGEISNFIAASSGHWYLSLKDAKSQVKCAMFKGKNQRTRITPKNGQQVLVRAKVSLYEPRGDFQIIIELMEEAGEGLLKQQYEQLKQKLNALGLFAQQFKQQIPKHITRVGLVTSPTGAAVKDIISILKRRNSSIQIVIYPALVQGEQAKFDIVRAIDQANAREECDVLIVGRGGGSLEDLWPFNEEDVVEAIFHSKIPTISAVGHEIDTTLSDYVADLRAPTPSAAAELVSQDLSETLTQLTVLSQRVQQNIHQTLSNKQQVLQSLQHRLSQVHPEQKLQVYQQKADELAIRLEQALKREFQRFKVIPMHLTKRLTLLSPLQGILHKHEIVQQQRQQLIHAMQQILARKSENFVHLIEQLNIVSPLATIARGYSVSRSKSGIIRSVHQIELDEKINIQVKDGIIEANVVSINDQK
ncbi:exodeoxyribonuclease VII large subunit [Thalassotalea castellviae]|uniref:Exodeoxyribonuclease 7 large subunit n=1 Tax=Thalassotalea castellviae TaxID=3075612 RepID=A0ABU3A0M5_9GAMM|nr:exodeoxyribonuclease VII large subunit [Thalassotalea sp. W431]MDT0603509.1 exodeoxyribonuclease VII large subunit [Thalassotalea sp. W431]